MWERFFSAYAIEDVLEILAKEGSTAKIIAGGTDLMLELRNGLRPKVGTVVDISRIHRLSEIWQDESGMLHVGALASHNDCVASRLVVENAFPLAQACWSIGSPQIRNRGSIGGNLVTASPANDTIPALVALGASVVLRSSRGERIVPLDSFYLGVRKTVMEADELMIEVLIPPRSEQARGVFIKHALRNAQAISLVNTAIALELKDGRVASAAITLGAVAPVIIHASKAETFLVGKPLTAETAAEAAAIAMEEASPISDIRSSASYRKAMVRVIVRRGLEAIRLGEEKQGFPDDPVLLWGDTINPLHREQEDSTSESLMLHTRETPIVTRVNGKEYRSAGGQTGSLLDFIRNQLLLTGSKEGCAEGECGACTVYLDGAAVMSCLVPAPRGHGAEIVTIEGLADEGELNLVQSAFVEEGAVQCGFCTPGFVMSATKLLEEVPNPTKEQIKQSITGNLCRCTGYYKIIRAIEQAAEKKYGISR
ncbi:MAG: FAD binding domain-containing protein [Anaerolineaceae bacterium]|nr:FAD binding domain-containing protein [Anaerolineaceae bacterium]